MISVNLDIHNDGIYCDCCEFLSDGEFFCMLFKEVVSGEEENTEATRCKTCLSCEIKQNEDHI